MKSDKLESPVSDLDGTTPLRWWSPLIASMILIIAGVASYANTLEAPFVFDGINLLRGFRPLSTDYLHWFRARPRSLTYFTFDLQYTLHGFWLPPYHVFNIAVHLTAAVTLYGLVLVTCRGLRPLSTIRQNASGIALTSAILFELHPLQTQAVTYLYQRSESLMGMFFLIAVLCFALGTRSDHQPRWANHGWLIGSWLAVLLSLASKEVGVVAPFVLLWYDRVFRSNSWRTLISHRWWFYLPFVALITAASVYLVMNIEHYVRGGLLATDDISPLQYALSQPEVVCHYLRLVFWPQGQCLDLWWQPADSFARIIPPLLFVAGIGILTLRAIYVAPAIGFLLGSFALILAPTSSVAPIIDLAFEHRMYLPLAPLAVFVTIVSHFCWVRFALKLDRPRPASAVAIGGVAIIAAALGTTTFLRNAVYRDHLSVWQDVVKKSPRNPRGWAGLGDAYLNAGRPLDALAAFDRSIVIEPMSAKALGMRARAHARLGRDEAAINDCQAAVRLNPYCQSALDVLAESLVWCGHDQAAVDVVRQLTEIDPPSTGRYADRHGPRIAAAAAALAGLAISGNQADERAVLRLISTAKGFDPDSARTLSLLGLALLRLGKAVEAKDLLQVALTTDPNHPHAARELVLCTHLTPES